MTDQPKLNAYIVALKFGDGGPLYVNAMIAPNEVIAASGITAELFQKEGGGTDKQLIGVSVGQLMPEFLRIALAGARARASRRTARTSSRWCPEPPHLGPSIRYARRSSRQPRSLPSWY